MRVQLQFKDKEELSAYLAEALVSLPLSHKIALRDLLVLSEGVLFHTEQPDFSAVRASEREAYVSMAEAMLREGAETDEDCLRCPGIAQCAAHFRSRCVAEPPALDDQGIRLSELVGQLLSLKP